MSEARRTFTREFKVAAVKLVTEKGKSVPEAARTLGIAAELLRRWTKALQAEGDQAFPGHGNLPPDDDELRRLRAENARLKAERDILKKADRPGLWGGVSSAKPGQ
jgi:transposase